MSALKNRANKFFYPSEEFAEDIINVITHLSKKYKIQAMKPNITLQDVINNCEKCIPKSNPPSIPTKEELEKLKKIIKKKLIKK